MTKNQLQKARIKAIACAENISLPLRSRVWRGMAGEFSGAGSGSSLDFQDHRNYVPGDDPRHINWQAYARTGSYTMKLYREEVRPVVDIILDTSNSMFFESEKATRVAELFYTIVSSSTKAGASTNIHLIKGSSHKQIPLEAVLGDQWFSIANELKDELPNSPPNLEALPLRPNTIRVFISDLLFPGDPNPVIRHFTQRQGSLIILSPFSQSESNPDWQGNYEFVDAESSTRHPHRIEPNVLRDYKKTYNQHFSLWYNSALKHQSPLARIPSHIDLMEALQLDALKTGALEIAL